MKDCLSAFEENERKFYGYSKFEHAGENFDLYDSIYNFKGVSCPNCDIGFQVGAKDVEAACPMCGEVFIVNGR